MKRFVTIEGCEGVGKSTQIRMLKEYLERTGQPAVFTREPGGTPVSEKIREILLDENGEISPVVEAYLFAAARAAHVERVIRPALERGELVICDRFIDSSIAYQGQARELGFDTVLEINAHAVGDTMPDCTVFIDMSPENSWRKQKGNVVEHDRMEAESAEFHKKVYEGFLKLAKENSRFVCIQPEVDKNATHQKIVEALRERGMIR